MTKGGRRAALEEALRRCLDDPGLNPGPAVGSHHDWIHRSADRLMELGAGAVFPGADGFPPGLLGIPEEPTHLFTLGVWPPAEPQVAIVGTRRPTAGGLRFAGGLARALARHGVGVVSGLALGIDGAAHRAALDGAEAASPGAGPTVAVLATGLERVYPPAHAGLRRAIVERGALVTEFAPGAPPLRYHFLRRNRLISGMARVTVVIEAGASSGALVTAEYAVRQGREVFAVPGDVYSPVSIGTNRLIEQGAAPLVTPEGLLGRLRQDGWLAAGAGPGGVASDDPDVDLPRPLREVLARMESSRVVSAETLALAAGRAITELWPLLIDLELRGFVRRAPGGYVRAR